MLLAPAPVLGGVAEPPRAVTHDQRTPAGRLVGGVLSLELEVQRARWYPEAADGPAAEVAAFGERGSPPSVPGPLIRVREGTRVRITLHNTLSDTLYVLGLATRPMPDDVAAPLRLSPGETRMVEFSAGAPGTYFYWATTTPADGLRRLGQDTQLNGAFIIDPSSGPRAPDRVFLMSIFGGPPVQDAEPRVVMTINGRSFPHTERPEYLQDDTVHWRVINATRAPHPMHLHGFYYHIQARSDNRRQTTYAPDEQPFVVTEHLASSATMDIRFIPHEPGFWAFHCHFAFHSGGHLGLTPHELYGEPAHAPHTMAGLVVVFFIRPDPLKAHAAAPAPLPLRLLVRESADTSSAAQRMSFLLHNGGVDPPADALALPSSPLVLRRDERVAVTIVNRLREPTQIHWHGIELESYPDGIPGISGMPGRINPAIAPRDSFTAVFAPPRAGTFIYHAHMNDAYQINLGLYGALLVLEPDAVWNPERDHIVLVGGGGRVAEDRLVPGMVNGSYAPRPLTMRAGETHRFRIISIHPDNELQFALVSERGELMRWRAVAKDGADLAPAQRHMVSAYLVTGPGETADFEFTPDAPGDYRLEIKGTIPVPAPGWYIPLRIQVR